MQRPTREEINNVIEELRAKLEEEPNNPACLHDLGVAFMHLQDWPAAEEYLNQSLEYLTGKQSVTANYHLGTIYAEKGDMDKAIEKWKQVIKLDDKNVFGHFSIAKAYAMKELYDASIMHLKKADRYNTNRSLKVIHQNLARVLMLKGDFQEAINAWKKIVDIDNKDIQALHEIAMLYLYLNEMEKALEYCQKELDTGSKDPSIYYNAGLAHLSLNQAAEAIVAFEKALAGGLTDINIRVNLGEAFARLGKVDEAIRAWEQVLAIDPQNIHSSYNIGVILYDHNLFERAITAWKKTLAIKADYLPAIVSSGSAYLAIEEYRKAYDLMKKAKDLAPNNAAIRGNLAEVLLYLDKPEEALAEAHHAANLQENNALAFLLAGCAYALLEQWLQAATALQQAYEIDENIFRLTAKLIQDKISTVLDQIADNGGEEAQIISIINRVLAEEKAIADKELTNETKPQAGMAELLKRFLRR